MQARDVFEQVIRVHRVLWAALTASQGLLVVVLFLQREHMDPSRLVPASNVVMMCLAAAGSAIASFVVPARALAAGVRARPQEIVRPEPTAGLQLPPRFADPMRAARHAAAMETTALILKMALAEAVSLCGFVLGFLGSPPTTFLPFFAVGLVLAVIRFPTVDGLAGRYERASGATFAASDSPTTLG
jgi:hypothetical protein